MFLCEIFVKDISLKIRKTRSSILYRIHIVILIRRSFLALWGKPWYYSANKMVFTYVTAQVIYTLNNRNTVAFSRTFLLHQMNYLCPLYITNFFIKESRIFLSCHATDHLNQCRHYICQQFIHCLWSVLKYRHTQIRICVTIANETNIRQCSDDVYFN